MEHDALILSHQDTQTFKWEPFFEYLPGDWIEEPRLDCMKNETIVQL